jgi:hypothetical protein
MSSKSIYLPYIHLTNISLSIFAKYDVRHAEYPAVNLSAQTYPDHRQIHPLVFDASEAVNLVSIRSTHYIVHYIVHCVGDVIMPTRYEL